MPNFIKLSDGRKLLGEFNLPARIELASGSYFSLGKVRKAGGNGVVLEATHYENHSIKRTCALKFLRRLDAPRMDRFENEARIVNLLAHDNIATYYGQGYVKIGNYQVPWVAQELGGRNMREHVDSRGPIEPAMLKQVALQMCSAVEHLHSKGFIHRDIKPENFVWAENSKTEVLMIDLGIAKRIDEDVSGRPMDMITRTLEFVGPLFFSSPELIAYAKDKSVTVDERSDIFQLGKTLWFLGTGQISAGVPSRALCPMNGKLRDIVLATVDDDPDYRPQTIADLREKVNAL
jgi:serine/threonine protein kinase